MVPSEILSLRASLDTLAAGDLDVRDARSVVRQAVKAGDGMADRVYTALRDLTWRTIAARDSPDDLGQWYDLSTHAAALVRMGGREDLSERLTTLGELIAQAGRFADRQPLEELLERRHVGALLLCLAEAGGEASRTVLATATQLADANLSRVLAILSAHGLIRRRRSGKEAIIALSAAGRIAAGRLGAITFSPDPTAASPWWDRLELPVAVWSTEGEPAGSNSAFRSFALKIECPTPSALSYQAWSEWLASAIREERKTDQKHSRDLQVADSVWVRHIEHTETSGTKIAYLIDISELHNANKALARKLHLTEELNAKLKVKLSHAEVQAEERERRLLSFGSAFQFFRSEMVDVTAALAVRLRTWLEAVRPAGRLRIELENADRQIRALKLAMQHFMAVPLSTSVKPDMLETFDPTELVRESVDIVRTLSSPKIEFNFTQHQSVMANTPTLRAAIGQALMTHIRETHAPHYVIKTSIEGKELHVLFIAMTQGSRAAPHDVHYYQKAATEDGVILHGYGYCRDLAEDVGGSFYAGKVPTTKGSSFVQMVFPIETKTKKRRAATLGRLIRSS